MDKIVEKVIWDSDFFDMNIYKIITRINNQGQIELLNNLMKKKSIDLYYYFLDSKDKENIKLLEFNRFYLVQYKTSFELNLCDYQNNELYKKSNKVTIFNSCKFNIKDLYKLSKQVYEKSRFYNDNNINKDKVKELYELWIYNSYYKGFADNIYAYVDNNEIYGFFVIKSEAKDIFRISLICVDKEQRGKRIANTILSKIFDDYKRKNYRKCLVSTQISNISTLNFNICNGFKFYKSEFIFHKWNNKKGDSSHENSF